VSKNLVYKTYLQITLSVNYANSMQTLLQSMQVICKKLSTVVSSLIHIHNGDFHYAIILATAVLFSHNSTFRINYYFITSQDALHVRNSSTSHVFCQHLQWLYSS